MLDTFHIVHKLKDSLLDIYINSYIHKLYETILFFTGQNIVKFNDTFP